MSKKLLKINELKKVYSECNDSRKEAIVEDAINNIKALLIMPDGKK